MTIEFEESKKPAPDTTERMGFALMSAKVTLEQLREYEAEGRPVDRSAIEQLEETIRQFEAYADERIGSRTESE